MHTLRALVLRKPIQHLPEVQAVGYIHPQLCICTLVRNVFQQQEDPDCLKARSGRQRLPSQGQVQLQVSPRLDERHLEDADLERTRNRLPKRVVDSIPDIEYRYPAIERRVFEHYR